MLKTINSLELADILLAFPFTSAGQHYESHLSSEITMTAEEKIKDFLEHIYTKPFFLMPIRKLDEGTSIIDDSREDRRYNVDYVSRLNAKYEDFIKDFLGDDSKDPLSSLLYILIGSAGCGKTTFSQKMLFEQDNIFVDKDEFETHSNDNIRFLTTRYRVNEVNPINALLLILMQHIGQTFVEPTPIEFFTGEKVDELKIRISEITNVYNQYFNNHLIGDVENYAYIEFFEHLEKISPCNHMEMTDITAHIYDYLRYKVLSISDEKMKIKELTGILLRLYFCISQISGKHENKKILLFIDNIEQAIVLPNGDKQAHVITSHIKTMLHAIYEATNEIDNAITQINIIKNCKKTFAVLLAMRDSTYGILLEMMRTGGLPGNGHRIKSIEMSDWFDAGDIFSDRLKYHYKCNSIEELLNNDTIIKKPGVTAYSHMTSDRSQFQWGLNTFLTRFYNNSKRHIAKRLVGCFLHQYEQNTNQISYNSEYLNKLEFFNRNWVKATACKSTERLLYNSYIQLCRKYIVRLLFDYANSNNYEYGTAKMQQESFFEKIHCIYHSTQDSAKTSEEEKYSFTRRILTYLANQHTGDYKFRYVTVGKLIKDVLIHNSNITKISKASISNTKLEIFSDVLFSLNEIRDVDTNWTGLIYVDMPEGKTFLDTDLRKFIKSAWKTYVENDGVDRDDKETVTVCITEAGDLFSRFMPDFECFACRYSPNSTPLLAVDNNKTLTVLLENVFKATQKCIVAMDRLEKHINPNDIKWNFDKKHSARIINRHIGYLQHFRNFLNSKECGLKEKEIMAETISDQISKYNKLKS